MGIEKEAYSGALYKSSKVDVRRLFVAAMVHLYQPQIYHQPEISLGKNGFVMTLAGVLKQHEANVSAMIREVISWEREYDDFKEKVTNVVAKLKEAA